MRDPACARGHVPDCDCSDWPALRPMKDAPKTGEILVATTNRAGCNGWLIVHHADGGGEEQPRFRGWFFWSGYDFREVDATSFIGWMPLPSLDKVKKP